MRSKICIEFDIITKQRRLCELQYTMDLYDTKTVTSTLLQVSIMYDVTLFIVQRGKEFVLPIAGQFVGQKGKLVCALM